MVTPPRDAASTVGFIDHYCWIYRSLFKEVRHYESFKYLHLGMLSEIPRKSLPAIAKAVGLKDGQGLHHFLRESNWQVSEVRETRLWLTKLLIGEKEIVLMIDETGDAKKGKTTDYVARQYIGNLGKTKNGIVSVNAYAVVSEITYPLIFKIFKPRKCLQPGDEYKTKPQIAQSIIRELKEWGFKIKLVLADSLYGESGDVIGLLEQLKLSYIVAIRSNHGVLMPPGAKKRYNQWRAYQQHLSQKKTETRYIREIIFGKRRKVRYYQISKKNVSDPSGEDSWYIMTNLSGNITLKVAPLYSLRNWIEYGFKQVKNELGWADYRLTDYASIEKWWEIVFSTYFLVSIQANYFRLEIVSSESKFKTQPSHIDTSTLPIPNTISHFNQHCWWSQGTTWKSALNNLRLIIQPYIFYCLIRPWLQVFQIPGLKRYFLKLVEIMNHWRGLSLNIKLTSEILILDAA
jgi:SRSO17 transposase